MFKRNIHLITFLIILNGKSALLMQRCDHSQNSVHEGNVGQIGMFPWLGVLRVHLHNGGKTRIALTGLALVKDNYAIANADDIIKIPGNILKSDSKAMFILNDNEPWTCLVKDYMMHPEYEYLTYNTIALVELDMQNLDLDESPLTPVCWPLTNYNISTQIYAVGYTDENKRLEKSVYGVQYLKISDCEEFYSRSGLIEEKHAPTHYHCAFSNYKKDKCVWENGMALVSNTTGLWKLIGFSIRGPVCTAPGRFIDITHYYPWIQRSTSSDYEIFRRKSSIKKKPLKEGDFVEVPIHTLLAGKKTRRLRTGVKQGDVEQDNVTQDAVKQDNVTQVDGEIDDDDLDDDEADDVAEAVAQSERMFYDAYNNEYFTVDRLDEDAIGVAFHDMYEKEDYDCNAFKKLVYKERMEIKSVLSDIGSVVFKIAVYDLRFNDYNCVTLKIDSKSREKAQLWYKVGMDTPEGFKDIPREILRPYPFNPSVTKKPTNTSSKYWTPHENLEPTHLKETFYKRNFSNINILVKFTFSERAVFLLEVFGPPKKSPPKKKYTKQLLRSNKYEKRKILRLEKKENYVENVSFVNHVVNETINLNKNCSERVKSKFVSVILVQFSIVLFVFNKVLS